MRFTSLALLLCALAVARPTEDDGGWDGDWSEGKGGSWGKPGNVDVNKIKDINRGTSGGGGSCDPAACDIKCNKLGDQSGYCDTSQANAGLLGHDVLGDYMPGCICVPNTSSCTTTTTTTTTISTSTCTATTTQTQTSTETQTITSTQTSTSTTTTTATACPTVACFCCTGPQNQLPGTITGNCDAIQNSASCPIPGGDHGHKTKVCCNGNGKCSVV